MSLVELELGKILDGEGVEAGSEAAGCEGFEEGGSDGSKARAVEVMNDMK